MSPCTLAGPALADHGSGASGSGYAPPVRSGAIVLAGVATLACRGLLDERAPVEADKPPGFALPTRPVLLIGLVGLCAVFADQAGTNWSALYILSLIHI